MRLADEVGHTSYTIDPKNSIVAAPSILPSRSEGYSNSDKVSTVKRRPVRRDPQKGRQQNIQAEEIP